MLEWNPLKYSNLAPSTPIKNTADPTDFDVSYILPANALQIGDLLDIELQWRVVILMASTTLALGVSVGDAVFNTIYNAGAFELADGYQYWARLRVPIHTLGKNVSNPALFQLQSTNKQPFVDGTTVAMSTIDPIVVKSTADWELANFNDSVILTHLSVKHFRRD